MNAMRRAACGFTLIEMVITVAIVGLLASIAAPLGELVVKRDRERELRVALREIRTAIDAYKQAVDEGRIIRKPDESGYPPTLEVLVDGVVDARDPNRRRIYFLRRIPPDPMGTDPSAPPATTWALRSYESPPDDPRPGADVFDVASKSSAVGLNGQAYGSW